MAKCIRLLKYFHSVRKTYFEFWRYRGYISTAFFLEKMISFSWSKGYLIIKKGFLIRMFSKEFDTCPYQNPYELVSGPSSTIRIFLSEYIISRNLSRYFPYHINCKTVFFCKLSLSKSLLWWNSLLLTKTRFKKYIFQNLDNEV